MVNSAGSILLLLSVVVVVGFGRLVWAQPVDCPDHQQCPPEATLCTCEAGHLVSLEGDTNGDGVVERVWRTLDDEGRPIQVLMDLDADGQVDRSVTTTFTDRFLSRAVVDDGHDGLVDEIVSYELDTHTSFDFDSDGRLIAVAIDHGMDGVVEFQVALFYDGDTLSREEIDGLTGPVDGHADTRFIYNSDGLLVRYEEYGDSFGVFQFTADYVGCRWGHDWFEHPADVNLARPQSCR